MKNINIDDHITLFEKRLADFLTKKYKKIGLTVDDIKDIIWNSRSHHTSSEMAFFLSEENPKVSFQQILDILGEAWNNFPHKNMNGLSPRDMVQRLEKDENFIFKDRVSFYEFFENKFPDKPYVNNMGKNTWSWEYPAIMRAANDDLIEIENTKNKLFQDLNAIEENDMGVYLDEIKDEMNMINSMRFDMAQVLIKDFPLLFESSRVLLEDAIARGDNKKANQIAKDAIFMARHEFPEEFKIGKDTLPWGFINNRPFLNLLFDYAIFVRDSESVSKAILLFEEIIALNPNDNQGVRALLATSYLQTNKLDELLKLENKYPNDLIPELSVGSLLAIYKLNKNKEFVNKINKTKKYFGHIYKEIIKTDHPKPDLIPGRVRVGGDDESWLYWQGQGNLWMATPGARELLRSSL